ncbi:hypothetical protein AQJ46_38460 [Streptomyces canus]|uniref:Uncharacterized protein n=1 Tax=Streptomyces canus TaxID=58343 RepID=A0A117QXW6_9ACTN|nr:hypothetical protein AQJ46_38460 [Streptomyces canus]
MHPVGTEPELVGQRAPRRGQAALGAERGLGRAGRAGGEVEEEPVVGGGAGGVGFGVGVGREQGVVLLGAGHQQTDAGEVEAPQQRQVGRLRDQQAALGVQDVAGQFESPAGGVDAGDGGTGERGGAQPQRVLGGVVEQHTDVGPGARQQVGEQRRPGGGADGDLMVGEHPPLEPQPGPVVAPPAGDELRDRTPPGVHGGVR